MKISWFTTLGLSKIYNQQYIYENRQPQSISKIQFRKTRNRKYIYTCIQNSCKIITKPGEQKQQQQNLQSLRLCPLSDGSQTERHECFDVHVYPNKSY